MVIVLGLTPSYSTLPLNCAWIMSNTHIVDGSNQLLRRVMALVLELYVGMQLGYIPWTKSVNMLHSTVTLKFDSIFCPFTSITKTVLLEVPFLSLAPS